MEFHQTPLNGSFLIELKPIQDERGMFARVFCQDLFIKNNLETNYPQSNFSTNYKKGTIRGLHQQKSPNSEVKVVRCTQGNIYDVIVDNRPESDTYLNWYGAELSDKNNLMMYVPRGFLHGYLTLSEISSVHYMVSNKYAPESEIGARFDDPKLNIKWPTEITEISEKDKSWPMIS